LHTLVDSASATMTATIGTATASAQHVGFMCDKLFDLSLNGTTYYIPCATATA